MTRHSAQTILDVLRPQAHFFRSVSLERDLQDPAAIDTYVVTPWLRSLIDRFLAGAENSSTRRAWRLTGDFGVGKSALALALARYLDPRTRAAAGQVAAPERRLSRLFPVALIGSRSSLGDMLADAVRESLAATAELDIEPSVRQALLDLLRTNPAKGCERLTSLIAKTGRFDGVFLAIDELGKFLEHAAATGGDIMALQNLAEAAARSGGQPFILLTILHQGVTSYAESAAAASRSEWAKVAERFEELTFDHPLTHTAALVAAAFDSDMAALPAAVRQAYVHACGDVDALGWIPGGTVSDTATCYPLHPSVLAVALRFFSLFGQNERSLFGFLASEEPFGVRAFSRRSAQPGALYCLDDFFDFVANAFGGRIIGRNAGADWSRIQAVVRRASDQPPLEARILKIVGLLTLTDAEHLVADASSLAACLGPDVPRGEVEATIDALKLGGMLFERSGLAGLRLWAARRVDINALWREAESAIPRLDSVADALAVLAPRGSVLARRHAIQTGTLRQFSLTYLPHSRLIKHKLKLQEGDGSVLVVLSDRTSDQDDAWQWANQTSERDERLVVAVLPPLNELSPLVLELRRAQWLEHHASALRDDSFAAAELSRQIAWLETRIQQTLSDMLGLVEPATEETRFVWSGKPLPADAPLHGLISKVCDDTYRDAPHVQNELINRRSLSSAAAAARQRLLEALFVGADKPSLGLPNKKSPPERALYLSILQRGCLHICEDRCWRLALPESGEETDPLHLRPVLDHLDRRLKSASDRVSADTLIKELAAPPFGVRGGLALLLLGHILALHREHLAVYERGTFAPRFDGSGFMRLTKTPGLFAFQWAKAEGVRAIVFSRLAEMLCAGAEAEGLLSVVTPLVQFGVGLPFRTLKTQQLSPRALQVRQVLISANSPVDILFRDLPEACGCSPFEEGDAAGGEHVETFVERLHEVVEELRSAYDVFVDRVRQTLFAAMGAQSRETVAGRASRLIFRLHEPQLRAFSQRLADSASADDTWVEAVAGTLVGKTPNRWLDADEARWQSMVDVIAGQFARAEAVSFTGEGKGPAVRLALTAASGDEVMKVVTLPAPDSPEALLATSIADTIREQGDSTLILAQVASLLLNDAEADSVGEAAALR
ncbi:MAG: hypothetical protein WBG92_09950 [Thiohalocapsa sp.]